MERHRGTTYLRWRLSTPPAGNDKLVFTCTDAVTGKDADGILPSNPYSIRMPQNGPKTGKFALGESCTQGYTQVVITAELNNVTVAMLVEVSQQLV
jgi:hypothetical protein